jgi:hypothetical protein
MKKDRFLGYLDAVRELAADGFFSDADGIVQAIDGIIEKAEQLDEPVQITYPTYPTYPTTPWSPWPGTWITSNNTELDNPSEFEYNGIKIKKDPLVGPNDWEVKCNTAPNFTVVK